MSSRTLAKNFLYAVLACTALSACGLIDKKDTDQESNWLVRSFEKDGASEANAATVAYSQGNFKEAEQHVLASLKVNPRNTQALIVGAMMYEKVGRPNRARQFYEDLIVINGNDTSILGAEGGNPEKLTDIAKRRLRLINVKQSDLIVEEQDGTKVFNVSKNNTKSRSAIEEALFLREKRNIENHQPSSEEELKAVEVLFNGNEQNIISRFLILKELAEKDLITKEEFLTRRQTNIGGLLPLTHTPGAYGIDKSVPSPDLIIERINVLKDAVESRAITPREFSAERDTIIEALLPPNPRTRMRPKAPSRDILGAAKDLRKLEILYDLNLITSNEKIKEQKAIENYLGLNRAVPETKKETQAAKPVEEVIETKVEVVEKAGPTAAAVPAAEGNAITAPISPNVSSPF